MSSSELHALPHLDSLGAAQGRMAAENSPRKGIVRLHVVDGRSWPYRGFWLLSLFLLSFVWVAVLNCCYPFYVSRRYFAFIVAICFVDGIMLNI